MTRLKIVSLVLALIGVVVIGGALMGLMVVGAEREQYRIYYDSDNTSHFTYTEILESDHEYQIVVTMHDDYYYSAYGYEALVDGKVVIYIDGVVELNADLYDSEYRDEDSTGADATDSAYYEFTPTSSVNVTIAGVMTSGDDWTIEIYRDVPEELDERAGVQLIYLSSGFVLFILGLGLFAKARQTP